MEFFFPFSLITSLNKFKASIYSTKELLSDFGVVTATLLAFDFHVDLLI
jgi:hypothetical protein